MSVSDTLSFTLSRDEAQTIDEALERYEESVEDETAAELDSIEDRFDEAVDAVDGEVGTTVDVELTSAETRPIVAALSARERVTSGDRAARFGSLRERFEEPFDFAHHEAEATGPEDEGNIPGGT